MQLKRGGQNKAVIREYQASEEFTEINNVQDQVMHWQVKKCMKDDLYLLEHDIRRCPAAVQRAVRGALEQTGAIRLHGKAPAAGLERKVQTALDRRP